MFIYIFFIILKILPNFINFLSLCSLKNIINFAHLLLTPLLVLCVFGVVTWKLGSCHEELSVLPEKPNVKDKMEYPI